VWQRHSELCQPNIRNTAAAAEAEIGEATGAAGQEREGGVVHKGLVECQRGQRHASLCQGRQTRRADARSREGELLQGWAAIGESDETAISRLSSTELNDVECGAGRSQRAHSDIAHMSATIEADAVESPAVGGKGEDGTIGDVSTVGEIHIRQEHAAVSESQNASVCHTRTP